MSDQLPVRLRYIGDLVFRLLDAVLRQVGQAQLVGGPDAASRYALCDRQEGDVCRVTPGAVACLRDARADGLDAPS